MTKEEALQKARTEQQTECRKQWLFNALSLKINNTMDYELALALKKAGFPQKNNPKDVEFAFKHFKKESVYIPNLEEVIEACGENFEGLERLPGDNLWGAYADVDENPVNSIASTRLVAVAHLYIALQDKTH